jgi:hypothetical protein
VDLAYRSSLVDSFRQGGVPLADRLLAARGGLSRQVHEQLQLLMLLAFDPEIEVAKQARATIARLPADRLAALVASPDVPSEVREFYANPEAAFAAGPPAKPADAVPAGVEAPPAGGPEEVTVAAAADALPGDTPAEIEADPERRGTAQRLAMLTVSERVKIAMQGSREERSILVRDPNRLVSSAVLGSPKLTESEVEAIARMTNVSDEVLRMVGSNRNWTKSYGVISALTRNPKTPVGVALTLLPRLLEREVKALSTDRNVPEPIRLLARKLYTRGAARRQ